MKTHFLNLLVLTWAAWAVHSSLSPANANAGDKDETALWLARSCVGEAGWKAHQTGECLAIWHIYRKRTFSRKTILQVALKYSAAIKPRAQRKNRWVLYLLPDSDEKPKHFPRSANWDQFKSDWRKTYSLAVSFTGGPLRYEDPAPLAMHYGSIIDPVPEKQFVRLRTPKFRNRFYAIRGGK